MSKISFFRSPFNCWPSYFPGSIRLNIFGMRKVNELTSSQNQSAISFRNLKKNLICIQIDETIISKRFNSIFEIG